jgi:hypothetical protein
MPLTIKIGTFSWTEAHINPAGIDQLLTNLRKDFFLRDQQ